MKSKIFRRVKIRCPGSEKDKIIDELGPRPKVPKSKSHIKSLAKSFDFNTFTNALTSKG